MDQLASSLIGLGLSKGDRVGIWGQNHLEWLVTFLASVKAGTILVRHLILNFSRILKNYFIIFVAHLLNIAL